MNKKMCLLTSFVLMLGMAGMASAATWTNGDGDGVYVNPLNWDSGLVQTTADWGQNIGVAGASGVTIALGDAAQGQNLFVTDGAVINMTGGSLDMSIGRAYLGNNPGQVGTLNISDGVVDGSSFEMGNEGGTGISLITGGTINLTYGIIIDGFSTLTMTGGTLIATGRAPVFGPNASVDISGDAVIGFAWNSETLVQAAIDAGIITANGGAGTIVISQAGTYDPVVLTAVPEPATMTLLGLGSLALIRRKK